MWNVCESIFAAKNSRSPVIICKVDRLYIEYTRKMELYIEYYDNYWKKYKNIWKNVWFYVKSHI